MHPSSPNRQSPEAGTLSPHSSAAPAGTEALVLRAAAGDGAAVERLWVLHRRYAATVIIAHKPASADTDDLLQDVAATLVAKVHTIADPANFLPWLRMVALNAARLAGRRQASTLVRADSPSVHGGAAPGVQAPSPQEPSERRDHAQSVLELARRLPEEYREPLLLQALREMSYREIGRALDLPETTVETRISRARKMLRDLARAGDGGEPRPGAGGVGEAGGAGGWAASRATGPAVARILWRPDHPSS